MPASPERVAAGEARYLGTAGGVACVGCHGAAGKGGAAGPIVGASASSIRRAIRKVPAMSSLGLSEDQIDLVAEYLQSMNE